MKRITCLLSLLAVLCTITYAEDFSGLNKLHAADIEESPAANIVAPVASIPFKDELPLQDLIYRFTNTANKLKDIKSNIFWAKNDIDTTERAARHIIQTGSNDIFFQSGLQRLSTEMNKRISDTQRMSYELKVLLNLSRKSDQLNNIARNMDLDAREILSTAWPDLENVSQNLEWTILSGKPEIIGYGAQWTATEISRNCKDFSDQARNNYYDVRRLLSITSGNKPVIPNPIPIPPIHPITPGPITPNPAQPAQDTSAIEQCKDDCNDQYGWDCDACADLPNPTVRKVCYANAGSRLGTCVRNCHRRYLGGI